jgi:endoglucanase
VARTGAPSGMGIYTSGVAYRGINRAGGEFGDFWTDEVNGWNGQTFYTIPTAAELGPELTYYADTGFNVIRFPISWERLQHELKGSLDPTYRQQVETFVATATAAGFLVVVDLHNYNRYATDAFDAAGQQVGGYQQRTYGDGHLDASHLVDVWTRLATLFRDNPRVAFGLMNEPHDFSGEYDTWFADLQEVLDAIRATGARQLVLVPNSRGSDVEHWFEIWSASGTIADSDAALSVTDSADNYAFDLHQYHDAGSETANPYIKKIAALTEWATRHGKRLFLSELGAATGAAGAKVALQAVLDHLDENGDVWIGWTPWNLPPHDVTAQSYTADGNQSAWYAPYLIPGTVAT